jgi:hypothetical protein
MTLKKMMESGSFIKFPSPIKGAGFSILGIFPYGIATVKGLSIPRQVAHEVFKFVPTNYQDNKIVIVCQDDTNFGTNDFAVLCKDMYCIFGRWDEIILL